MSPASCANRRALRPRPCISTEVATGSGRPSSSAGFASRLAEKARAAVISVISTRPRGSVPRRAPRRRQGVRARDRSGQVRPACVRGLSRRRIRAPPWPWRREPRACPSRGRSFSCRPGSTSHALRARSPPTPTPTNSSPHHSAQEAAAMYLQGHDPADPLGVTARSRVFTVGPRRSCWPARMRFSSTTA